MNKDEEKKATELRLLDKLISDIEGDNNPPRLRNAADFIRSPHAAK